MFSNKIRAKLFGAFLALALIFASAFPAHATTKYVNSVQQGTVTIASGATTGTATVTAATGTFWLIYDGCITTATTSNAQAFARISVSGTTVTATRGASSTNTVTCSFSLIDATANLIASVQAGTIATTTASGTATISSVTTGNCAVFLMGMTQTLASFHYDLNTMTLVLTNATTVTANNINGASGTTTPGYEVVCFNPSALNQNTQAFSKSWTNTTGSTTQTITSVNVNNAMIAFAGGGSSNGDLAADEQPIYQLTNGTTITISVGNLVSGNPETANGTVIEFVAGVLKQSAQRGTIAIASATSNTATITSSALTNTALNVVGFKTATTATTSQAIVIPNTVFTNATTLTANLGASGSATQSYEALQFQDTAAGGGTVPLRALMGVGL